MFNEIVNQLDPTPENPRNSEGSFVTLKSGRILFAYSRFTGGGGDHDTGEIAVIHSDDDGRTWSEPRTLIPYSGGLNSMSVSFLRLQDERIALMYLIKNTWDDCRPRILFSSDEAETWSEPVEPIQTSGYFVVNNDRLVETSSGKLIVPAAFHRRRAFDGMPDPLLDSRSIAMWYLSDDGGKTWHESSSWWALPVASDSGLQETGVIELDRERLFSWCRTSTGYQWGMQSGNGGESWSAPQPTKFISPNAPLCIKRIPGRDKLLGIWNDISGRFPTPPPTKESWGRTPLVCALGDTAKAETWTNHKVLEDDPDRGFCYTAIHFVGNTVLLAYCAGGGPTGSVLNTLRMRRVSLDWIMS